MADGTADGAKRFETVEDKSVYWTASFYVAAERLPRSVLNVLQQPERVRDIRAKDKPSKKLSDAIEPLFNDISDRERGGKIDDFLFATAKGEDDAETWIDLAMDASVSWTTEGLTTIATPPDPLPPQKVRVRRFWYLHRDGAVTWHVSFWLPYGPSTAAERAEQERRKAAGEEDFWHRPALLYYLSRLQKVLAPKEFAPSAPVAHGVKVHRPPQAGIGIAPLDGVRVQAEGAAKPATFWEAMGQWFATDAAYLFDRLDSGWKTKLERADKDRAAEVEQDPFFALVGVEPFLEAPGLMMPRFRYMFFFVDETFFNRLMPPVGPDGQLEQRVWYVNEVCYRDYLKKNDELTIEVSRNEKALALDGDYWRWVLERPDIKAKVAKLKSDMGEEKAGAALTAYKADKRAYRDDRRPDCLNYLFLSGFNQNIIDFMAQDASEVLDSLDPVYPESDDRSGERFFVRYATPRGFLTYVRASRSLEAGNDHIGTCPYAFLIHVLALHNEYLARDYEVKTETMIADVRQLNENEKAGRAVERFYRFRMADFTDFARNIYGNVFRYDTEGKVFAEVERRRGIRRKTEYLDVIVENLEKQTNELQSRLAKREDRVVTFALASVGIFGALGLGLQLLSMYDARSHVIGEHPDWLDLGLWLSLLTGGGALGLVIWTVLQNMIEEAWNRSTRNAERKRREKEFPATSRRK